MGAKCVDTLYPHRDIPDLLCLRSSQKPLPVQELCYQGKCSPRYTCSTPILTSHFVFVVTENTFFSSFFFFFCTHATGGRRVSGESARCGVGEGSRGGVWGAGRWGRTGGM